MGCAFESVQGKHSDSSPRYTTGWMGRRVLRRILKVRRKALLLVAPKISANS
jgi:hypothetical protein